MRDALFPPPVKVYRQPVRNPERMEILRIVWVINFFFFALIVLFVWSKIVLATGKLKTIMALIERVDGLRQEMQELAEKQADSPAS